MYTGTLIKDLMATVERAERGALKRKITEEVELKRMFELQISPVHNERIFAGAA